MKKGVRTEACNFIKKETLAQVFSCEFCEIFKNMYFEDHLRKAASWSLWFSLITLKILVDALSYLFYVIRVLSNSQPAITCSKLTIETLEQGVKYVSS